MLVSRHAIARRRFLRMGGASFVAACIARSVAASPVTFASGERSLSMVHTHTGETIDIVYARGEAYLPDALAALNRFLRDHYSGDVGTIDPALLDLLHRLHATIDGAGAYHVISAYRSPATNERLRATRGGGVARSSLHMEGRAIDVRIPGVPLATLRDRALALEAGGVGYYPSQQFVHVDVGRVRRW